MKSRTFATILFYVITLNTFTLIVEPWNLDSLYKVPDWKETNLVTSNEYVIKIYRNPISDILILEGVVEVITIDYQVVSFSYFTCMSRIKQQLNKVKHKQ